MAIANNNVRDAAPKAAYLVLKPISSKMPRAASSKVLATAAVGIKLLGKKEFTCAVYDRKLLQPDDCLPHKVSRLATADKKPVAKAVRRNKV